MTSEENRKLYSHYKNELKTIYDDIADDIRIKSNCACMSMARSPQSFFLNLEKKQDVQNRIRKLIVQKKRNNGTQMIKTFYETLFKRNCLQANVENQ